MTVRRMKTYTGATGYVYQYYFVGRREALEGSAHAPATEFIFDVTSDRKTMFAASIFIDPDAVDVWSKHRGRSMTETEQYAAAKMRLFQAFDEEENLMQSGRHLTIGSDTIEGLLSPLKLD